MKQFINKQEETRIDPDEAYMQMAEIWSKRSYATRMKVGALLVDPIHKQIISDGWNGMPIGFPNEDVESIINGEKVTNPLVIHAESNCILKCAKTTVSSAGCTLYIYPFNPCIECTKLIIQAGIKRVVYRFEYRITDGIEILRKAGVEVIKLEQIVKT